MQLIDSIAHNHFGGGTCLLSSRFLIATDAPVLLMNCHFEVLNSFVVCHYELGFSRVKTIKNLPICSRKRRVNALDIDVT